MTWGRALVAWLALLTVGFLNGTARQLGYGPWLGEPWAHRVSTLTAVAALAGVVYALWRRWPFPSRRAAWGVGALWALLTVGFELSMGRAGGVSWGALLEDYALWRGHLWPLVPLTLLFFPPLLAGREVWRRP